VNNAVHAIDKLDAFGGVTLIDFVGLSDDGAPRLAGARVDEEDGLTGRPASSLG